MNEELDKLGRRKHYDHGECRDGKTTSLYIRWVNMMSRCYNIKNKSFKTYGGCGIDVCSSWHDRRNFFRWARKSGYKENLQLDRIDGTKGYSPTNCRWVTVSQQQNNRKTNVRFEYFGEVLTLEEAGRKYKMDPTVISRRIRRGISPNEAVSFKGKRFDT